MMTREDLARGAVEQAGLAASASSYQQAGCEPSRVPIRDSLLQSSHLLVPPHQKTPVLHRRHAKEQAIESRRSLFVAVNDRVSRNVVRLTTGGSVGCEGTLPPTDSMTWSTRFEAQRLAPCKDALVFRRLASDAISTNIRLRGRSSRGTHP